MRVALVRGTQLGAWDFPNYALGPGFDIDVFISRGYAGEIDAGFGVRRLPSPADLNAKLGPRVGGAVQVFGGSPQYLVGLERALKGYDVAHTIDLENPTTVQAIRARRAGRCRRVVASVMENIPLKPQPPFGRRTVAAAAAGVDHCIAITERARVFLQLAGVPDDRITLLPVGTDLERFRPAGEREPGPMRVVSVARLEPGKGVEDLVIAVGLLARRGITVELTFVGSGPLHGRLQEVTKHLGIESQVRFDRIPWPEIERAYRAADVFVLASGPTRNWREQFGFAVAEAMASGLPVLVGASGSLPEVVGRPESLVAPHDPLGLAEALEELERDESLRAERGAWNRRRAEELFDHRDVRSALAELYQRVLAEPARD